MEVCKSEEMVILKFEDRDSREPLTFNSSVCLKMYLDTADNYFLSFNGVGDLRVEHNKRYDEGNNSIAKLTKWIILDARNVANRNIVTPFDDICLKSPFNQYFSV